MQKGIYIVAEGQDCNGKGTLIDGIVERVYQGKRVLDLRACWRMQCQKNPLIDLYGPLIIKKIQEGGKTEEFADIIPEFSELQGFLEDKKPFDVIVVCEPTWAHIGLAIRKKYINEILGKGYTGKQNAEFYSDDRRELLQKIIIPARAQGIDVLSERDRTSTYVFQMLQDNTVSGIDELRRLSGNRLADNNRPDITIILELEPETALERAKSRGKDDKCKYETIPFQKRVREKYLAPETKRLLESIGTKVVYVNTDSPKTAEHTKSAGERILRDFLEDKLQEKY